MSWSCPGSDGPGRNLEDECQLLGYLDKGKRKRKEKAGSLQWAYMAIARLGGFMDSKRTGIASWGALW